MSLTNVRGAVLSYIEARSPTFSFLLFVKNRLSITLAKLLVRKHQKNRHKKSHISNLTTLNTTLIRTASPSRVTRTSSHPGTITNPT